MKQKKWVYWSTVMMIAATITTPVVAIAETGDTTQETEVSEEPPLTLPYDHLLETKEAAIPEAPMEPAEESSSPEKQDEKTEPTDESTTETDSLDLDDTSNVEEQETDDAQGNMEEISPRTTSTVSTWAQFRTAINNQSVTVINVTANISGNTSLNDITRNLTINGNGHTINTQSQNIQIGRGNRTLRINNVTLANSISGLGSQIRSRYQNTGATIILSSVNYNSPQRLVGSAANYTGFHVVFEGGVSRISGGTESAIVSADSVTLTSNAQVYMENKRLYGAVGSLTSAQVNSLRLHIDAGSSLLVTGSSLDIATISVNGELSILNSGFAINTLPAQTGIQTITAGSNSSISLTRTTAGAAIASNANKRITIQDGADFDLRTITNSPIINDAANRTTEFNLQARTFSMWDQGIDHNNQPSHSFQNLQFRVTGPSGSTLESTNNTVFSSIYPQNGLARYSRISTSHDVLPRNLSIVASPPSGGNPMAGNQVPFPGTVIPIWAVRNSGYRFVRWEIVSGEGNFLDPTMESTTFTMGNTDVTLRAVYERIPTTLTLQASPTTGGTPRANSASLPAGASTSITANPNAGYRFVRWENVSGDGQILNSSAGNTTFTMGNSNATVRAVYEQIPRSLRLEASPVEGGSPSSDRSTLTQGQTANLTANPNDGYMFVRWEIVSGTGASIDSLTAAEAVFTMGAQDTVVQAIYEENQASEVHVYHVDQEGHEIADTVVLEGEIGENYQTVAKKIAHYQLVETPDNAQGVFTTDLIVVTYVYEVKNVSPVDPLDPEEEVDPDNPPITPENQGLISIDFASQFNFGAATIGAGERQYDALPQRLLNADGTVNEDEERPNYLQISDRRSASDRGGWSLSATLSAQGFRNDADDLLTGAQVTLSNQQLATTQSNESDQPHIVRADMVLLRPGVSTRLLDANAAEGTGTWIYRFGDQDSASSSVQLAIPSGANPKATAYQSTINWELSAVPGNN